MNYIRYCCLLACWFTAARCQTAADAQIPYPAPLPDSVALRFLPGIVSGDSLDFNAAFSPDGRSFYFCRSSGGRWQMLCSRYDGEQWTAPVAAPFNEAAYSQADPFFGPDGALYYISNRPRHASDTIPDYDIWRIRPQANGAWSAPENLAAVNSDSTEYYVSLSQNGNIYFASSRTGGYGSFDIYVSRLENGRYTTPENLGPAVNSPAMEHDPCISPDEQLLLFTAVDRADGHGSADIYYTRRTAGKWSAARNAGPRINTDTYEYCGYLTPDGQYFFFSSNLDVRWISTRYLPEPFQ
ncbi:TolB family protein [Chitinophaga japonensis]|nr:PD40 domain-containing protein [Chitinophaga japonensis]